MAIVYFPNNYFPYEWFPYNWFSGSAIIKIFDGDVYTTANNNIIEFIGEVGDSVKIITMSNLYNVDIEDDGLCWYDRDNLYQCLLEDGDSHIFNDLRIQGLNMGFTIELIRVANGSYIFTVTYNFPDCDVVRDSKQVPPEIFQAYTVGDLAEINMEVPPKSWADFNTDHYEWVSLVGMAKQGLICWENLPDEPKIETYTD